MNFTPLVLAALVAGLTALDNVHVFQWMLSRPVVTGPIVGAIMGDLTSGMICGAWIELIWLGVLPIGNYTPPDAQITAASAATAAAVWSADYESSRTAVSLLAVLAFVPIGVFSKLMDLSLRKHLAVKAEAILACAPPYRTGGMIVASILPVFAKAAFAVVIVFVIAVVMKPVIVLLTSEPRVSKGLFFAASLVPALGMVQLARCIGAKGREKWILLGVLAATVVFLARGVKL